jgi:hypothetical protein
MPVDAAGNRADFIMDGFSTLNRMNPGRLYEQYTNAASRDLVIELRSKFGIAKDVVKYIKIHAITAQACSENYELWKSCWLRLMDYYKTLSPKMHNFFRDTVVDTQINHLSKVLTNGIYLYLPTDNQIDYVSATESLMAKFPPVYGPVSYTGYSGIPSVTKDPVLIGSIYMLLLEKTADDWSGVSSARIQHFGVLAPINKNDKYSQPTRNQPVKVIGETEGRIFVAYCEQPMVAEVMDRNNSPTTHRNVVWNLLKSDKPSNIASIVDRQFIPLGSDKPSQIISHIAMCAGWRFKYEAMPTPTYTQSGQYK